jgi:hypothetical protein
MMSERKAILCCPFCGANEPPEYRRRTSATGYVVACAAFFVALPYPPMSCLLGFVVLCIAALMTERVARCKACKKPVE